jgi:hypothetical protein
MGWGCFGFVLRIGDGMGGFLLRTLLGSMALLFQRALRPAVL